MIEIDKGKIKIITAPFDIKGASSSQAVFRFVIVSNPSIFFIGNIENNKVKFTLEIPTFLSITEYDAYIESIITTDQSYYIKSWSGKVLIKETPNLDLNIEDKKENNMLDLIVSSIEENKSDIKKLKKDEDKEKIISPKSKKQSKFIADFKRRFDL